MASSLRHRARAAGALGVLLLFARCASAPESMSDIRTPATRTVDVVDDYHGNQIADPYRWLEDLDHPDVQAWIAAQNVASAAFLATPERERLHARLTELWDFARRSPPQRAGERWLWRYNDGLQDQPLLMVGDRPQEEGRVLIDPNQLSADGTVALG